MTPLRVGLVLDALDQPVRQALYTAARSGATGVQADATGELAPDTLGDTARREVRKLVESFALEPAALNVPLRNGLDVFTNQQPRLDHVKKVMLLATDIGCKRVVVPFPRLPGTDAADATRANTLRESLLALVAAGDKLGVTVCPEVGFDTGEQVRAYLGGYAGGLSVTYDPANFLLHGHDPVAHLLPLQGLIGLVHARDARQAGVSKGLQEVKLGAGDIDWLAFTATLHVIGYTGFMLSKREQGDDRAGDVLAGVGFLRRFAGPPG